MPTEIDERPEPTIFVLFGASGDLARRMVLPAFYELFCTELTPQEWILIGNSRNDRSDDDFRKLVRASLEEYGPEIDDQQWQQFADRLVFAGGSFDESDPGRLVDGINAARERTGDARLVHFLAVPPGAFARITEGLAAHRLIDNATVVYEKPYGESLKSFRELDELVQSKLAEEQVFRIDHFLGKEGLDHLHPVSTQDVIQVQIDTPEVIDVADRGAFYEPTGGFKDMIVTHLFQLAAEVARELPDGPDDPQAGREAALKSFRPLDPADAVFGQYEGYQDHEGVAADSTTDTFAAVRLWVDNQRWQGIPFVLRHGKQLAEHHELITLIKKPSSADQQLGTERVDIDLVDRRQLSDPYVRLLHDVLTDDRSRFTTPGGLEAAWQAAEPLLADPPEPIGYRPGSWGPQEAERLTDGVGWVTERGDRAG
jgi:glucose-6-phosphate 1-dehydrogenase